MAREIGPGDESRNSQQRQPRYDPTEPEQEEQGPQGGNQAQMMVQIFRQAHNNYTGPRSSRVGESVNQGVGQVWGR